jgi:hypothetical protein
MRFLITAAADPNAKTANAEGAFDPALFAAYMSFNEEMFKAGVLIASEGLNPGQKSARVGVKDGKRVVLDGPYVETKELVGGFYFIEVDSLDEAVAWALRAPSGMGADDVLTVHALTGAGDLPPEIVAMITAAAPLWSAKFVQRMA